VKLVGNLSTNGFRAILFDLDGTLRHSRPHFAEAFIGIAARLGVTMTTEDRWRAERWLHKYWARSEELVADRVTFDEDLEAFWSNHARRFLMALGCAPESAGELAPQAYQLMNREFNPDDWVAPDVPPALEKLRNAGYQLAVLSNRMKPYQEQLETLGLAPYFEFAMHAGEMEAWKPDPQIFERALQQVGAQPQETLYVGDNYYADVIGSRNAGLTPVLLDPDGLFPEADCTVIRGIGELPRLLGNNHKEHEGGTKGK